MAIIDFPRVFGAIMIGDDQDDPGFAGGGAEIWQDGTIQTAGRVSIGPLALPANVMTHVECDVVGDRGLTVHLADGQSGAEWVALLISSNDNHASESGIVFITDSIGTAAGANAPGIFMIRTSGTEADLRVYATDADARVLLTTYDGSASSVNMHGDLDLQGGTFGNTLGGLVGTIASGEYSLTGGAVSLDFTTGANYTAGLELNSIGDGRRQGIVATESGFANPFTVASGGGITGSILGATAEWFIGARAGSVGGLYIVSNSNSASGPGLDFIANMGAIDASPGGVRFTVSEDDGAGSIQDILAGDMMASFVNNATTVWSLFGNGDVVTTGDISAVDGVFSGAVTIDGVSHATTPDLIVGDGINTGAILALDAPAGSIRRISGRTISSIRWSMLLGTDTAEGGADAGSNFALQSFTDAAAFIDNPIAIDRISAGDITIGGSTARTALFTGAVLVATAAAYGRLGQNLESNTSANYGGAALNTWSTTAAEGPLLDLNRSKSASLGTYTTVAANDSLGGIVFRGADGNDFSNAAIIEGFVDGVVADEQVPGRIVISTNDAAGAKQTAVTIDSAQDATLEGVLFIKEETTPTPVASYGAIYTKADNGLYFQDGDGNEHTIHLPAFSSLAFNMYNTTSADTTLTNANEWYQFTGFAILGSEGDAGLVSGSVGNDEFTVNAGGAGEYRVEYSMSLDVSGTNQLGVISVQIELATAKTVTDATNATPIVVTTNAAHDLRDGDGVTISGVIDNTNANGDWWVNVTGATTFELYELDGDPRAGNDAYGGGGTVNSVMPLEAVSRRTFATVDQGVIAKIGGFPLEDSDVVNLLFANITSGAKVAAIEAITFQLKRIEV